MKPECPDIQSFRLPDSINYGVDDDEIDTTRVESGGMNRDAPYMSQSADRYKKLTSLHRISSWKQYLLTKHRRQYSTIAMVNSQAILKALAGTYALINTTTWVLPDFA